MKEAAAGNVGLLGTGTCRISDRTAQNSAFVRLSSEEILIIDVGIGVPSRLATLNLLDGLERINFHISHLHIDHLMGLFGLLQSFAWSDDPRARGVKRVTVRCTEQVGKIFNDIVKSLGSDQIGIGDCPSASKYDFELITYPNESDWEYDLNGINFNSVHLPDCFNHGLRFVLGGVRYAFTCDATTYTPSLADFLRHADIGVFDCGHLTNFWDASRGWRFDPAVVIQLAVEAQTPVLVATHHYLRQHQNTFLSEVERQASIDEVMSSIGKEARDKGYKGEFRLGKDLMILG